MEENTLVFDMQKNRSNVIKVIGVGGGGSNAINHMFNKGITGVDFVICNTDAQALQNSPVVSKIQLGAHLTEGMGAGANPEVGEKAALESKEELKELLATNTKMVFITAGMGGGTGTGAAPIIADIAREMGILTVAIVTVPFKFEGKARNNQASLGIEKLKANVDSLIVINNNKLRDVYGNLGYKEGFSKADEVLATASKSIAEVITTHYTLNIDLNDAKTVLANSGTAIMGSANARGEDRAINAVKNALDSPLLNDNKITGAQQVLLKIVSSPENEITLDEISLISEHIQAEAGHEDDANIITGIGEDSSLQDDEISVTVVATGFSTDQQDELINTESKKIIHTLGDEQTAVAQVFENKKVTKGVVYYDLSDDKVEDVQDVINASDENGLIPTSEAIKNIDVVFETISNKTVENESLEFTFSDGETITKNREIGNQFETEEPQIQLAFEPQKTTQLNNIDINNINIVDAEEISAKSIPQTDKIVHTLFDEDEKTDNEIKPITSEKEYTNEIKFVVKEKPVSDQISSEKAELKEVINPFNSPAEEVLKMRKFDRIKQFKEFNHKFNLNNVDDYDSKPAYLRKGLDISSRDSESKVSRTSVSKDSNNDTQLRNDNSFLHDNVD